MMLIPVVGTDILSITSNHGHPRPYGYDSSVRHTPFAYLAARRDVTPCIPFAGFERGYRGLHVGTEGDVAAQEDDERGRVKAYGKATCLRCRTDREPTPIATFGPMVMPKQNRASSTTVMGRMHALMAPSATASRMVRQRSSTTRSSYPHQTTSATNVLSF